jgi:hypothetical protein
VLREAIARSAAAFAKPAAVAAPLLATTALTSTKLSQAELEARKNDQHKAEDIIYTLNHAITCLSITDFLIAPLIGAVSEKWFGKRVDICGQDHGDGHKHHDHGDHTHTHHEHKESTFARIQSWVVGEFVGDVGAVPITIAAQRFAPGFMNGIRQVLEPVTGWIFKRSTDKAAKDWGAQKGFAPDAQEVVEHAHKLYEYEMRHIPQMAVWTAASVGINYATMKVLRPKIDFGTFIQGKSAGAAITAGLVLGVRALAPETAHTWDQTVGKNVIVPISKKVGGLFGVKDSEIDEFHERQKQDRPQGWAARTQLAASESLEQPVSRSV